MARHELTLHARAAGRVPGRDAAGRAGGLAHLHQQLRAAQIAQAHLAGHFVIDFIDMEESKNRREVENR